MLCDHLRLTLGYLRGFMYQDFYLTFFFCKAKYSCSRDYGVFSPQTFSKYKKKTQINGTFGTYILDSF